MRVCESCEAELEFIGIEAIDPDGLQDLSAAIRRGDTVEAEHLLDRLFAESSTATWRIQSGRMGGRARRAA